MFESEATNPALNLFTFSTISAWLSMGCETKMNPMPPDRASAMAIWWSVTDCMIAEANGTFSRSDDASPVRYFTRGLPRFTEAAVQSFRVRLGISRYSLKVREGSG